MPASGISKIRDAIDEALSQNFSIINNQSLNLKKEENQTRSPIQESSSIFINGLPWETDENDIMSLMSKFGKVKSVEITRKKNGQSLGRGLVEFNSLSDAKNAIAAVDNSEFGGRTLSCRFDRKNLLDSESSEPLIRILKKTPKEVKTDDKSDKIPNPNRIFISNLSWDTTPSDLTKYFETIGLVAESEIHTSKSGRSLGSGFVQFVDSRCVSAAILQLNSSLLDGREIGVREYYQ